MTHKVLYGQNIIDVCVSAGSVSLLFELAELNTCSPTAEIISGNELQIPVFDAIDYYVPFISGVQKTTSSLKQILYNQSLADITVQHTGVLSRIFEIALLNNLSVTSEIIAGNELLIPETGLKQKVTVLLFKNLAHAPASAFISATVKPGGIGYMQIGNDFKVN